MTGDMRTALRDLYAATVAARARLADNVAAMTPSQRDAMLTVLIGPASPVTVAQAQEAAIDAVRAAAATYVCAHGRAAADGEVCDDLADHTERTRRDLAQREAERAAWLSDQAAAVAAVEATR